VVLAVVQELVVRLVLELRVKAITVQPIQVTVAVAVVRALLVQVKTVAMVQLIHFQVQRLMLAVAAVALKDNQQEQVVRVAAVRVVATVKQGLTVQLIQAAVVAVVAISAARVTEAMADQEL
jgi:hypothetical protein